MNLAIVGMNNEDFIAKIPTMHFPADVFPVLFLDYALENEKEYFPRIAFVRIFRRSRDYTIIV